MGRLGNLTLEKGEVRKGPPNILINLIKDGTIPMISDHCGIKRLLSLFSKLLFRGYTRHDNKILDKAIVGFPLFPQGPRPLTLIWRKVIKEKLPRGVEGRMRKGQSFQGKGKE